MKKENPIKRLQYHEQLALYLDVGRPRAWALGGWNQLYLITPQELAEGKPTVTQPFLKCRVHKCLQSTPTKNRLNTIQLCTLLQ